MSTEPKSDLAKITPDIMEIVLDAGLDEGIAKEIPIFRTLFAFYKTTQSLRDRALLKKIVTFLYALDKVGVEERTNFLEDMNNERSRRKIGEQLMLILDRLDDFERPELLARIFKGYMLGKCDYQTYQRLAVAIDRSFIGDLKLLKIYYADLENVNPVSLQILFQSGLVGMRAIAGYDETQLVFTQNSLGHRFIALVGEVDELGQDSQHKQEARRQAR